MIDGLVCLDSVDGFAATVSRLDDAMRERGISPILRLDHAAAAAAAGLELKPLLLLLFGDPRVGTSLMRDKATAGIDLPLKLLVWETDLGAVRIGYNDPAWLQSRHGLARAQATIGVLEQLLHRLMVAASGRLG